jgi:outer membrane lipoprotein-sorting protein
MRFSSRSRALHWSAPFAVAGAIGLIALVSNAPVEAKPNLPPLSAQQLIAKVQQANVPALSGTLSLTSNLGIPNVGSLRGIAGRTGGFNPVDLLSGNNQAKVWVDGPQHFRVALIRSMAEYDVIRNGNDLWTWDSSGSQVQHKVLSAADKAGQRAGAPDTNSPRATDKSEPSDQPQTPDQIAKTLLDHLNPSTAVSVTTPANVANHAVYELVLTPRAAQSTVDHAAIAVDSKSGLPLQISLFAKGQKKAALQFGFTDFNPSRPAASNFSFKPPPGSTIVTNGPIVTNGQGAHPANGGRHHKVRGGLSPADPVAGPTGQLGKPVTVGQDWTSVYVFPNAQLPAQAEELLSGASRVSGAFGSGRLLQTGLINVLVLNDGRVAAGAVTPAALEAAVASAR